MSWLFRLSPTKIAEVALLSQSLNEMIRPDAFGFNQAMVYERQREQRTEYTAPPEIGERFVIYAFNTVRNEYKAKDTRLDNDSVFFNDLRDIENEMNIRSGRINYNSGDRVYRRLLSEGPQITSVYNNNNELIQVQVLPMDSFYLKRQSLRGVKIGEDVYEEMRSGIQYRTPLMRSGSESSMYTTLTEPSSISIEFDEPKRELTREDIMNDPYLRKAFYELHPEIDPARVVVPPPRKYDVIVTLGYGEYSKHYHMDYFLDWNEVQRQINSSFGLNLSIPAGLLNAQISLQDSVRVFEGYNVDCKPVLILIEVQTESLSDKQIRKEYGISFAGQ